MGARSDRFESTNERVYFFVLEGSRSRWFIASKADGTIVSEVETMIPGDYVEYHFWRRHDDGANPE
jgi:hypothetical protein